VPSTSGAEESDQQRESEAYNNSIYLMAGTPYLCLAVVGFLVYRAFRRKRLAEQAALSQADGTGAPPSSPDAGSGNVRPALF
jgi:hypothetical protein